MSSTVKAGLTTSALLKSIKRRTMAPDNQNTFTDQDYIDLLNEEMMIGLIPSILKAKEEYLIFKQLVPLVANKSKYPIPERALANKTREIAYRDTTNPLVGNEYEMTRIAIDDRYNGLGLGAADSSGSFRQFYLLGGDVVIHPGVGSSVTGALAFYYYLRPSTLVKDATVATITDIDRTAGTITLATAPTGYTDSVLYDFTKAKSPHNIIDIDIPIVSINISTRTITLDLDNIPVELEVGDYMPLAGQTMVPNVPTELHMILAQRVAQRVMEALGDTEGLSNATAKVAEMEDKMSTMMTSRVEGAPRKVVNRSSMTGIGRNRR
jgi:hypothetical protein